MNELFITIPLAIILWGVVIYHTLDFIAAIINEYTERKELKELKRKYCDE